MKSAGVFLLMMVTSVAAQASPSSLQQGDLITQKIQSELQKRYPTARIEVAGGAYRWTRGDALPSEVAQITLYDETPQGEVQFVAKTATGSADGLASYSAWLEVPVAINRVRPGERLSPDLFNIQEVNIARGMAHEYRGAILSKNSDFARLEARQTILEGQFPLTTGVQPIPDIRRGDSVRVRLISGALTLSTIGIAQEPGYVDHSIHILASKTKRELVGTLAADGVVEVKL